MKAAALLERPAHRTADCPAEELRTTTRQIADLELATAEVSAAVVLLREKRERLIRAMRRHALMDGVDWCLNDR
jgi:predicted ABC-type transport system involved in lysophospholipase L1 biosynthesis ATPase subunit